MTNPDPTASPSPTPPEKMSDPTYKHEMEIGDFHETDGWYFKRLPDGSVFIRVNGYGQHVMTRESWASVVAHLSRRGETGDSWQEALDYHDLPQGSSRRKDLTEIGKLFATVHPDGSMRIRAAMGSIPAQSFPDIYQNARRVESPNSAFDEKGGGEENRG